MITSRPLTRLSPSRFAAALLALGLVAPCAYAQFTPTGAGPFDYNTTGNWTGGTINGTFSQTPAAAQAVTLSADTTLATGLTFALGGSSPSLTLRGDGTDRNLTLGGDVSISGTTTSIVFGSTTAGNKLNITLGGSGRTFSVATGNQLTVNNVVSGGNAVTKTGAGSLTFAGANSYTGTTTVNGGLLVLNASGALASGNNVVINSTTAASTATVLLGTGFTQTIGTLSFSGAGGAAANNNLTLNTGSVLTLGGTVTYDGSNNPLATTIAGPGTLALGGNRTFNIGNSSANPDFFITAPISGTGFVLTKTGAGRMDLSGANSYDGGTIVNGGMLFLSTASPLLAASPVTVSATGGGTASYVLGGINQSVGALTLGGADSTSTSVNNVTVNPSGTLTLSDTVTYLATNNPLGSTIGPSGSGPGTVALGGNRTFAIADSTNPSTTNELTISIPVSGSGQSLTKTGAGTLRLSAVNTYDGGTILNAGSILLNASDTLASIGAVTVNNTAGATSTLTLGTNFTQTIGALTFGGAGASTSSTNNVTLNTGATLTLGGTVTYDATNNPLTATISGGTVALGGNRIFAVADSTTQSADLNISSNLTGAGATLTKTGEGRLALTGANTYDGGTVLNGGVIFVGASGALPSTGAVTINNTLGATSTLGVGSAGTNTIRTLTFGGAGASATSVNDLSISTNALVLGGTVTFDATGNPLGSTISAISTGTLALGGNRVIHVADSTSTTTELTVSSPVSGSGQSLTKTGAGVLTLSGANTYSGGTTVNGGTLALSGSDRLAAGSDVTINATTAGTTALVTLSASSTQTIGALTLGGPGGTSTSTNNLTLNSGATLTLGGTVTYLATGNPAAATIAGPGMLAIGAARTFDIGDSSSSVNEIIISAPVSGGAIAKIGLGNLNLSGANTYTGGTTVSAGGLVVRNTTGSGVGTGAVTIQNGANLRGSGFIAGFTTIQSGASLGTGGTGATPGNLTFTNGLTLNDGAIFNFTLGTARDQFTLTGGTLTGASTLGSLTINLTAGAGFGAGTYTLFDFSTGGVATSSFTATDFSLGTTISGYSYGLAVSSNTLQLTASAIPEPSTYAAIFGAVSLVGAAVWRRRARRG